jgi:uroporphyrinogen-III synthase/tetratricopeptide (TPR) repeat protein
MRSLIERQGGVATIAASLREVPLENNVAVFEFLDRLLASELDVVIFMTGVGARALLEVVETRLPRATFFEALQRCCLIVRGPKPTAVLREWGVRIDHRAAEPNTWRELLSVFDSGLARPDTSRANPDKLAVAIQEYGLPSDELYAALNARGMSVFPLPVYRWELPTDTAPLEAAIRAVVADEFDVLLWTSAQQVRNVLEIAERLQLREAFLMATTRCLIGSIGPTCSETLREVGLHIDLEPSHPHMGHLVRETLARWRSNFVPTLAPVADAGSVGHELASSPCLQGEHLSFTGTLAAMTHRQAMALAEQHGAVTTQNVSRQTTMLVVGEEGWPLERDGTPSVKLREVTEWRQQGLDIKVLPESEWLHLLGLEERRREVHQLSTPAMLSQRLQISVGLIRHWERIGLIKPVRKVYRLPYFDFQEVACVRRLSELLQAGVSQQELEGSLGRLQAMLPGTEHSLAQLTLLARDHHIVLRDEAGLIEPLSQQRLFDFDADTAEVPAMVSETIPLHSDPVATSEPQPKTTSGWLERGSHLLEENRLTDAVESFRCALMSDPSNPETHLHLAEALYRSGNLSGAFERFHVAVELDHQYLEAWTQLGCVADELGQTQSALEAFDIALHSHADYPDAHFHKAELLHRMNRTAEAITHWQAYLAQDQRGPWADVARQRLESVVR